ncbi:MAG TPA: GntR family transcriptional regulator [Rhizomicrobium sp.]|jgi:DNA-binding GntR family transcriptional regulator
MVVQKKPKKQAGKEEASASTSLRDVAYEEIKQRIITLHYRPGAYINEAQICKELDIGRTPVHMAIDRLSLESMVEIIPRKGVIVRPVSIEDLKQVVETRLINEPPAAGLAAVRATDEELRRLRKIAEKARLAKRHDVMQLMELDREFHATIANSTRNTILAQILKSVHERSLRQWFISLSDAKHQKEIADEHEEVIDSIASRNPKTAETVMRSHINSFARVNGLL